MEDKYRESLGDPANQKGFRGPVFIVGLPRSGTKLLRDLLNRNPRISIPEAETHFLPYLVSKYGTPAPFYHQKQMESFLEDVKASPFFGHMRERGIEPNLERVVSRANRSEWDSIIESLLRHFGPKPATREVVFGDKTPDYLKVMGFLRSIFPGCRFVHIIRDPRDAALSAWKVWGQHPYRTAHRWQDSMTRYRREGQALDRYMEVRYEDLLGDPAGTLDAVCRFLDCKFNPEMLVLERSNENTGDARGSRTILSDNTDKFWSGFSRSRIERIEEIAFDQMKKVGYPIHFAAGPRPLSAISLNLLRVMDLAAAYRVRVRKQGVRSGTRYVLSQRRRRVRV